LQSNI